MVHTWSEIGQRCQSIPTVQGPTKCWLLSQIQEYQVLKMAAIPKGYVLLLSSFSL
jgi:hypothetical protein